MSLHQIAAEYVLVYCTAVGLTALGEPSLATPPEPSQYTARADHGKGHMPVWMILIFIFLAFAKWFTSFLLCYVYTVITTVIVISSSPVRAFDAAQARTHPLSQLDRINNLIRAIRVVGAFKAARANKVQREETSRRRSVVSVSEVKADLIRRSSTAPALHPPSPRSLSLKLWQRITSAPCFRGFTPLMTISVAQWILAFITDFLLSGQPSGHKLGYGTSSLVLRTVFASAYAIWTHYTITKPSNKGVFDHFPKGVDVLIELWPLTALWSVAEHLCLSGPLAISRSWDLKSYAFNAERWNDLTTPELQTVLTKFAIVWALYVLLTATVAIPMTILTRRVYASMLSDEDLAIVPFPRGRKHNANINAYDKRNEIKKPGLTASEAWESLTFTQYVRVMGVYVQYWVLNQLVQWIYWWVNWRLHTLLGVDRYAMTRLPWSPVGVVRSLGEGKLPSMGDELRSEL